MSDDRDMIENTPNNSIKIIHGDDKEYNNYSEPINSFLAIEKKCGEIFTTETGEESFSFLCTNCSEIYSNIDQFTKHVKNFHLKKSANTATYNEICFELLSENENEIEVLEEDEIKEDQEFIEYDEYIETNSEKSNTDNENVIPTAIDENLTNVDKIDVVSNFEFNDFEKDERQDMISEKESKPKEIIFCEKCNMQEFSSIYALRKHCKRFHVSGKELERNNKINRKDEKKHFFCVACDMQEFSSYFALQKHSARYHPNGELMKIYKKQQNVKNDKLMRIEKNIFVCKLCDNTTFRTNLDLQKHDKKYHSNSFALENQTDVTNDNSDQNITCEICGDVFESEYSVLEHTLIYHDKSEDDSIREISNNNEKKIKPKKGKRIRKKLYQCELCGIMKINIQSHLRTHETNKRYECEICKLKFKHHENLKHHIKIHNGETRFQCNYCEKRFYTNCHRNYHERTHFDDRPYKCTYENCNRSFVVRNFLVKHIKIVHNGEKICKCDICYKGFTNKEDLKEHMVVHSNEKKYKCDICGKCYSRKRCMQRHKLIHKRNPNS